jgi:integrase
VLKVRFIGWIPPPLCPFETESPLRFHDLRHTAATLLLKAGVHPKIVSERLGHATVAITLDTYSHVMPDMQREAASAVDVILARP